MKQSFSFGLTGWLSIFAIFPLVYGARYGWMLYFSSLRGPFGLMGIFILLIPFLVLVTIIAFLIFGLLLGSYLPNRKKIAPFLGLIIIVMAYFTPLPPIQKAPTPEEEHFLMYRSDYEAVIELARNGQLQPGLPECRAGYDLPSEYQHTSENHCLYVQQNDDGSIVVQFSPFDWYHPIQYGEDTNMMPDNPCLYDTFPEVQLDDNWYICQRDWN